MKKNIYFWLIMLLTASILLPSCYTANKIKRKGTFVMKKIFIGDPRKNCNHPEHGEYMREREVKRMRKHGIEGSGI